MVDARVCFLVTGIVQRDSALVVCSLGTIAAGGTAQVPVVVQPTGLGYLTSRVSVKADQPDSHRLNNSRTVMVRVRAA